jgi:hypothetical protein
MIQPKPTITGTTHTLPFHQLSPRDFERLCLWLVEREGYQRAEHLGAAGREQGRDIVAWREGQLWAFQCKRVRNFYPAAAEAEVDKVLGLPDHLRPAALVFLVACDVSDETRARARARCADRMECHFWALTELDERAKRYPDILNEFFQLDRGGETVDMRGARGPLYKPTGPVEQHFGTQIHFHTHTSPTGIPLQRPPRAPHFTDREKALARLLADLCPGRVATLCGPGGIGKTALAAEAVWTLAPENEPPDRFPDGILFHSFYGQPDPALALEHIALSFGEETRPTPAEAALRALAGKQALLILDGAEEAADLRAVLDVRGGCGVLVTSRARKDALAARQDVEPLEAADAVDLLRKWGGDRAADTPATQQICHMVGRLPLAVRLAGRYLAETGESAAGYLEWLRETPLDALNHGQRRQESVRVLLEKSLAQVSGAARQVLAVVGLLALAPFNRKPIAAALDLTSNQLRQPLGELVNYGLLLHGEERYVVSHALVHTYARECCRPADGVAGCLAGYYDALAETESVKGREGYARLDAYCAPVLRGSCGKRRARWCGRWTATWTSVATGRSGCRR